MSGHAPTVTSTSIFVTPALSTPLVHIRTDPYAGRKYHASTSLPENTDLLGTCSPYSYTIWKRFRNEVCAECWRYDGGRRGFLTRRDDEGLAPANDCGPSSSPDSARDGRKVTGSSGAGLWFCNAECQQSWITREGIDTVELLRQLEGARQKKSKAPPAGSAGPDSRLLEGDEISQELVDRTWDAVRDAESSPKQVRRWRDLQLDDYETDMARYVLLALLRCCREQQGLQSGTHANPRRLSGTEAEENASSNADVVGVNGRGLESRTFFSLQTNELSLLRACPEILKHQTRIYQLLKGRFASNIAAASHAPANDSSLPLADALTIANVRTILGVDPGNSFGIWEVPLMEESECLGFAVYPIASFFNHHCSPNVRKERGGRTLRFLTTRPASEGEELCISYGHVEGMNWEQRQQELLEGWYFRCRCSRCAEEETGEVCS
ncbi:hypothetical protein C8Q76DRAFT_612174 [Earliella scabrosa]|nr:hypothetical protein C8Q76DRAFT_612174 [Earliella scabrosa]